MNQNMKNWLDEKMDLEREIKESSRKTFPLIIATLICVFGTIIVPMGTGFWILWFYQLFVVYETVSMLKQHSKLIEKLARHMNNKPLDSDS